MFVVAWSDGAAHEPAATGDRHRQQQLIGEVLFDRNTVTGADPDPDDLIYAATRSCCPD
ncbi:MAG: hypothetical protein H0V17_27515 [Deltaproteobacteria bacterium]|nr:hypothetical protein [Deltaproteobacteria bacterium]